VRIVLVTMDSHLASVIRQAESVLQRDMPGLSLVMHAADRWAADSDALAECCADIAQADIVIATMLFLDDHIRAVLPALAARRAACDAMLCCLSAGEVVRLTRLGRFDMSAEARGIAGLLKRLRGNRKAGAPSSGRDQMRMLRELPRLLRFIPGTAQDVRAYFLSLQYWLAGTGENIANLVRMLVNRYANGARSALVSTLKVAAPVQYPDVGLYHPHARGRLVERLDDLPRKGSRGTVGLLVMRSYLLAGNTAHYDGVIAALEARGLSVLPAFASGLDQRPAIERFFLREGRGIVDAVVSLTGFSLVGGPAYNDAHAAETMLAQLDVPYLAAHPLEFQTLAQWQGDARGLTPVEATMMVAIPELDGAIAPITFGGRCGGSVTGQPCDGCDGEVCTSGMVPHRERVAMLAARVAKIVELRRTARAGKRVAIVLFNFPPNAGATGTAAYLSVFESLHRTLLAMRAGGYAVEVPETVDALRKLVLEGNAARHGAPCNVAARVSADDHVRREPHLAQIESAWGPSPGRVQSDGGSILIYGVQLGNVFIGVQPTFGWEGDPMRLLFERDFAPTHAFSAFYRWMREDFAAHAVLHFGMHGALEFMPGKQTGVSGQCWPDRLIADLPNVNLYASNNPSEGSLAKRRAAATLISYLTPPVAHAGLYRGLLDLKSSIDRWRNLPQNADHGTRAVLSGLIQAQASQVDLAQAEPVWGDTAPREIMTLADRLLELEYSLIPHGLHVVGEPPTAAQRAETLDAAGITDTVRRAELDRLLAVDHEIPAILHALDGGYIRPAPGGDLLRNTDVLPTGRNLHGFDPFRIPSAFAVADGAQQAERLLARHRADGGGVLPETVAVVLWGTDNLKTEGGPIAQALWLMGAEPRHDSYGRLAGAQLVPLERLGRPRVDVMVTLSGIFRDLLPLQTKLLAEAAFLAASADEPVTQNFVRRHALAYQATHGGTIEDASLRVFGNAEGAYGANVNLILENGSWTDEAELGDAWQRRKGFAYGLSGRPARHDKVLTHMLGTVDATYQNLDSIELGITSVDHYFDTLGGISRAVQSVRGQAARTYVGDQTRGEGKVRTVAEQVALETRTRALNPKWIEPLLAHGHEGVRTIEAQVTNTMGWSATTGAVAPWVYQHLAQTYMFDEVMRRRLAALNPTASARIANRLIEAHERRYWQPDPNMMAALRDACDELEDRLEGIAEGVAT
jgi:magnesium chelatase subunit H